MGIVFVGMPAAAEPVASTLGELASASSPHRRAVIIGARGGDQLRSDLVLESVAQAGALLKGAGMASSDIHVFREAGLNDAQAPQEATRDAILATLTGLAAAADDDDETWLFVFGHANVNQRGYALATKGPRLRGDEFAAALDAIPGRQIVFVLTRQSAALLAPLQSPRRIVVTANDHPQQMNPPRLPQFLFKAWTGRAADPLLAVLADAARETTTYYENRSLALPERMAVQDGRRRDVFPFASLNEERVAALRLNDPAGNRAIWNRAFGDGDSATLADAGTSTEATPTSGDMTTSRDRREAMAIDISRDETVRNPMRLSPTDVTTISAGDQSGAPAASVPATDETRAMVASAKALQPKYAGYPAFYLSRDFTLLVNKDLTTRTRITSTLYVNTPAAADELATQFFNFDPRQEQLRLREARLIFPDGNYDILQADTAVSSSQSWSGRLTFEHVRPGCLIAMDFEIVRRPVDLGLGFDLQIPLQTSWPIAAAILTLQTPRHQSMSYNLYGVSGDATKSETDYSTQTAIDLGEIAAWEPLPFGPTYNQAAARCHVAAIQSWSEFGDWTRNVLAGSDAVDDRVREVTAELIADASTDADKVRAIYEYLSAIRYETTPIGARACRPHLPAEVIAKRTGDCKDKANALVAMARIAGIPGHRALLNRAGAVDPDFAGWQFNHMLAYFPTIGDAGLWLDATDGSTPFGTLPPGDVGRSALLLDQPEVSFKPVTLSDAGASRITQIFDIEPDAIGGFTGQMIYLAAGVPDYQARQALKLAGPVALRQYFQQIVDAAGPGMVVEQVELSDVSDLSAPLRAAVTIRGSNWSMTAGRLSPPLPWWAMTASPTRHLELVINDGQPITVSQSIRVSDGGIPFAADEFRMQLGDIEAQSSWQSMKQGWRRDATMTVPAGAVSPADYAAFRKLVHQWLDRVAGVRQKPPA